MNPGQSNLRLMVTMMVGFIALVSFNILYTNHERREADSRWCELVAGLDDNFRSAAPGSLPPRSVKFAAQVSQLRQDLRCPPTALPPFPFPQETGPSTTPSGR